MKAVLISIQPKWVEKIAMGEKTIEVRKTKPKLEMPFKCYIYCTRPHTGSTDDNFYIYPNDTPKKVNGYVIGEFVCDKINGFFMEYSNNGSADLTTNRIIYGLGNADSEYEYLDKCSLTHDELCDYLTPSKFGYGWHITDIKIYDNPKALKEFTPICRLRKDLCEVCCFYKEAFGGCCSVLSRPPQSWCYVEELK